MPTDREVAGLRCGQVLELLGDYLDGELAPERRAQVDAHLEGCDWCERFGGSMSGVVASLRRANQKVAPPDLLARVLRGVRES
jgi:anti-sigma factor RsiW